MRIGRIPYINCFPVYGAIDRGLVPLSGEIITGVPSALNAKMAKGELDLSVVSAVEYARDSERYLLLPDLAISCDGPVRSVVLFSHRPAEQLNGRRVLVSRSSMTSVALLELLFEEVWHSRPEFVASDAELSDITGGEPTEHEARLVIGDAALLLSERATSSTRPYAHHYDLGQEWKAWTGLPFVFAVWVAQRTCPIAESLGAHASLIASRDWGLQHLPILADQAAQQTGVSAGSCLQYLQGIDYGLGYPYLAGLTEFFRRLARTGRAPAAHLSFLPAA